MDKRLISLRYFTGTGNSLRVMETAREVLEERGFQVELTPVTADIPVDSSCKTYGFCFPVYSYDIPRIAKRFLSALHAPPPDSRTFLLVTAGGNEGFALSEGKRLLEDKGFKVTVTDAVIMPNNWLPFAYIPSARECEPILNNAEEQVREMAVAFADGREYHSKHKMKLRTRIWCSILFHAFKLGIKRMWRLFGTTDACTSCRLCERACPTGSIKLQDGRPKWSRTCEQCMRCINLCPSKAIVQAEAIGRGSSRNRYLEPHFRPADM